MLILPGYVHAEIVMFSGPKNRAMVSGIPVKDYLEEEGIPPLKKRNDVNSQSKQSHTLKRSSSLRGLKYTRLADW